MAAAADELGPCLDATTFAATDRAGRHQPRRRGPTPPRRGWPERLRTHLVRAGALGGLRATPGRARAPTARRGRSGHHAHRAWPAHRPRRRRRSSAATPDDVEAAPPRPVGASADDRRSHRPAQGRRPAPRRTARGRPRGRRRSARCRPRPCTAEGEIVARGHGRRPRSRAPAGRSRSRSFFTGFLMGMLVEPGQRVRPGPAGRLAPRPRRRGA